ncbi:MAG: S-ribosylhomocysteine lyase [Alphaproteobacteria bacterium]|nr:S-ribosylhomocysteine lyase [Alphaproteobacteria bacterium]
MTKEIENGWLPETMGDIDHTKMLPPFIRLVESKRGKNGDIVSLFDFRVRQPNVNHLGPVVLHSMEHILHEGYRFFSPDRIVNVSPMGCQTGFYIILLNIVDQKECTDLLIKVLNRALLLTKVPYENIYQCGQAKLHSLDEAKSFINEMLSKKQTFNTII